MKNTKYEILPFEQLLDYFGLFVFMYYAGERRGLSKLDTFSQTEKKMLPMAEKILTRLISQEWIKKDEQDLLHLNTTKFFQCTMWDIAVISHPFMGFTDYPPVSEKPEGFKNFMSNEKLSRVLIEYLPGQEKNRESA